MEIDRNKIDEAVLALLWLTRCDPAQTLERTRSWKTHDWNAMDWLHANGMIDDPKSKNKSVWFTEQGLTESERLFKKLFTTPRE